MAAQRQTFVTPEEYLEQERKAETKSEYMSGEVIAMSGASLVHTTIVGNIVEGLGPVLRKRGCRAHSNDLRVQIQRTGAYVYPDVVIVCGQPRLADSHLDTLLNPTVIIEVRSPSTSDYDSGPKWAHYRRLESLAAYVMVAQDAPLVEVYTRHADVWVYTETTDMDATLDLPSVDASISLTEIYDGVTFPTKG